MITHAVITLAMPLSLWVLRYDKKLIFLNVNYTFAMTLTIDKGLSWSKYMKSRNLVLVDYLKKINRLKGWKYVYTCYRSFKALLIKY